MSPDPTRRRFLTMASSGVAAGVAGCTADSTDRSGDGRIRALLEAQFGRRVDDWQYDPDDSDHDDGGGSGYVGQSSQGGSDGGGETGGGGGGAEYEMADGASTGGGDDGDLGFAVGGAQDVNTFRRNVEEGYLPQPQSLAYEGLFYDYYFDTGGSGDCSDLFCPGYSPAISPDPLSGEEQRFFTIGLDSNLTQSTFDRRPLNLMVVLDISGSMDGSFDRYYYDRFGNRQEVEGETDRAKLAVARDALVTLTEQLRPEDRLGVVLFDDRAHLAKPLRSVSRTDMDAIREHIQEDVLADGGTNIEAGIDLATDELEQYADADPAERENRTILLTDAMPNVGETSSGGLRGTLEDNAERDLFTSFVGIGLDFNAELVDRITSIRGANHYGVFSADEFERRMGEQFEYMVTPMVFDLTLEVDAESTEIERVYGSTAADEATGEIMHVRTLFPSPQEDGATRGGVVLVQLAEATEESLTITASWEERDGSQGSTTEVVSFPSSDPSYESSGVRKAVLLSRYANLLQNWTIHERDEDAVEAEGEIHVPPEELGRWEQQSEDLRVTPPYVDRISTFRDHFAAEVDALGDEDLQQELEAMDAILAAAESEEATAKYPSPGRDGTAASSD